MTADPLSWEFLDFPWLIESHFPGQLGKSFVFLVYKEPQENLKDSTQDQEMADEYLPLQESNRGSLFSSSSWSQNKRN